MNEETEKTAAGEQPAANDMNEREQFLLSATREAQAFAATYADEVVALRAKLEQLQKSGPTDAGGEPDRWLIQFNDDGEFGQATGWLYRDGGHPCSVTGQPVFVWSKLNELLAKTGHVIVRIAAHEVIGVEKVSALLNIEDPNIAIEPLTWHIVPGPKLPDADTTVLCQLDGDDEDCWPGYYDGERWISAEGFPFASRVIAWSQPRGVKP